MDEGVAVYVAPHEVYEYVTHHRFPFDMVPSMRQLDASYETVPGADLFAFALVEFIASQFGQESLNQLIRSPESMEEILGVGHRP
jgi:hypothetical protein